MLEHWIWLATRPGMGNGKKLQLLQAFSGAENTYHANDYTGMPDLTPKNLEGLMDKSLTDARRILEQCARQGIGVVTYDDPGYPDGLRHIYEPPVVLYYKGSLPDWNTLPIVGVVGSRTTTPYGISTARTIGYQLCRCGGAVVTGMAAGIDTAAAEGALMAQGMLIGVLGSGVDVVYPKSNEKLFARTEETGCLLSEYPPGTRPEKWHFPQRNRIISGLCCGLLVLEAPEGSGALITATQAREQGKDLFVVPGNINLPTFRGSNQLMRSGAKAVFSAWDILQDYQYRYADRIREDGYLPDIDWNMDNLLEEGETAEKIGKILPLKMPKQKIIIDNSPSPPYIDVEKETADLTPDERTVLSAVNGEPLPVDDVIAAAGLSYGKAQAAITMLEISGRIRRLPGNLIALKE